MLSARGLRMTQARGYADEMAFTLASANKVFYDGANVRQVDVPSFSGAFGILPKHVPTLGKNPVNNSLHRIGKIFFSFSCP